MHETNIIITKSAWNTQRYTLVLFTINILSFFIYCYYCLFFLEIVVGFVKEICNTRGENQKGLSDISPTLQESQN